MVYFQLTLFGLCFVGVVGSLILAPFQRPREMVFLVLVGLLFMWMGDLVYPRP
jgi:hypothetical protein